MDGFLLEEEARTCFLYECKIRNTEEAFWQLAHYERLLRLLLPSWQIHRILVCKYYDPVIKAPDGSAPFFLGDPARDLELVGPGKHAVFLYGGK